eukprot:gene6190-7421_t
MPNDGCWKLDHGRKLVTVQELPCSERVNKRGYFLYAPGGVDAVLRAGCTVLGLPPESGNGERYTHGAMLEEQANL